ncbi:hypothetical protein EV183_003409 [Coemansia sp. RSA 2336]|nr:hypothetical protein EV183_003409 [Coemansia sp. RSA 2336]
MLNYTARGIGRRYASRQLYTYTQAHASTRGGRCIGRSDRIALACSQTRRYTTAREDDERLGKAMTRSYSPFLTKFASLLPADEQALLRAFSDALKNNDGTAAQALRMYRALRRQDLHRQLTVTGMQRLLRRIALDSSGETGSQTIVELLEDYASLGFMAELSEYSSLLGALARERGREEEVLGLLDSVVENSDIAAFMQAAPNRRALIERMPTQEDIEQVEEAIRKSALAAEAEGRRTYRVSRDLYYMAMVGFAQRAHVRGVMAVLKRMLALAARAPYSRARLLMPDRKTWNIVGAVLLQQRDRPLFVSVWVGFLSRGARPPLSLTRKLVRLLVHQACIDQAVWAMRISRALPDLGVRAPKAPHAKGEVPWDLRVQVMHVAAALEAAAALDTSQAARSEALQQGAIAANLPQLAPPDPEMFSRLIGGAVRASRAALAEQLFAELVDAGVMPAGTTFGHLAQLYAEHGQLQRVAAIVQSVFAHQSSIHVQMLQTDVECVVPLLRLYVRLGREREARELLRSWDEVHKGRVPASKLALAMLRVFDGPEDTAHTSALLQEITPGPDAADAKTALAVHAEAVYTYIRARDLPGVVRALRAMARAGLEPPKWLWEVVLHGFLREQALDLFMAVHASRRDARGVPAPLSMPLYFKWMRTLFLHGDVVGVQAAFDEMIALGQVPGQQHYAVLVLAYAHAGMLDRAVALVHGLRRRGDAVQVGVTLNAALAEAYAVCGELDRANAELLHMQTTSPLPPTLLPARPFNATIAAAVHAGNGLRAMRTYAEMLRAGVRPNASTYAILMHTYALSCDVRNCMLAFNEMLRAGITPTQPIYTIIIGAFSVVENHGKAERVFSQVLAEQDWARANANRADLHEADRARVRNFFNLDPIIFIVMLSVYRRAQNPIRALATWARFIRNFPVVKWNIRSADMSRSYTANIHLSALTQLLRGVTKSIGTPQAFRSIDQHRRYMDTPLPTPELRKRTEQRAAQRRRFAALAERWPESTAVKRLSERMKARAAIVQEIEAELDARATIDQEFCLRQRTLHPPQPAADVPVFCSYREWVPEDVDLSQLQQCDQEISTKHPTHTLEGHLQTFAETGEFGQPTPVDTAAILDSHWRQLEDSHFAFNNIHIAVYLPSMLVGRQYAGLERFLSKVAPRGADKDAASGFVYHRINIDPRSTRLLAAQLRIVHQAMLADRDRRVLLAALLGADRGLRATYLRESIFGDVDAVRTPDQKRAMQERLAIHSENDACRAEELNALLRVARLWAPLVPSSHREVLAAAVAAVHSEAA